nr:tRNA-dihydrouridine(16/17) synthase [NAD(P)(+)]-like [Tanacetum cinerariifolium]
MGGLGKHFGTIPMEVRCTGREKWGGHVLAGKTVNTVWCTDALEMKKIRKKIRANWDAIRAVKSSLKIPFLANGNIRHMDDVQYCLEWVLMEYFQGDLVVKYLKLCEKYHVPCRMIRSHVHKILGEWFRVHP